MTDVHAATETNHTTDRGLTQEALDHLSYELGVLIPLHTTFFELARKGDPWAAEIVLKIAERRDRLTSPLIDHGIVGRRDADPTDGFEPPIEWVPWDSVDAASEATPLINPLTGKEAVSNDPNFLLERLRRLTRPGDEITVRRYRGTPPPDSETTVRLIMKDLD